MNEINLDGLPFVVSSTHVIDANGSKHPVTYEIYLLTKILQELQDISKKLDAPIVNVTNYPATGKKGAVIE